MHQFVMYPTRPGTEPDITPLASINMIYPKRCLYHTFVTKYVFNLHVKRENS